MRFGYEDIEVSGTTKGFQRGMTNLIIESNESEGGPLAKSVFLNFGVPGATFPWYGVDGFQFPDYLDQLTEGEHRLLESVLVSLKSTAWSVLHKRWFEEEPTKEQVFISYRSGHQEFAKALSERLGTEGFVPWFDQWEILAGESIPGRIEEGLRGSIAFIPILTADYQEGKWATEELESAIARRIEEGFPIIPVLLEQCQKPDLIRHLRHVDFSDHGPENFESRVADVIDGINRLTKNPFR